MSRIGKKPIPVPSGVQVDVRGDAVHMKGKVGECTQALPPQTSVEVKDGEIHVARTGDAPQSRAYHGLARALIANGVQGVSEGFEKKLEIVGIGYRAAVEKGAITLNVGYSHPVTYPIPDGIDVSVDKQTLVTVKGVDKQRVGQVAADIRDVKRPDLYKGKGIRYLGERVRQKVGKSGAK